MGDLKVDGIKSVILISIFGAENFSIILMTTSPVSSALCQVHNEPIMLVAFIECLMNSYTYRCVSEI